MPDDTLDLFDDNPEGPSMFPSGSNELHVLALAGVKGLGATSLNALLDHYSDLAGVWDEDRDALVRILAKARTPAPQKVAATVTQRAEQLLAEAKRLQESLRERGISYLQRGDEEYPEAKLGQLSTPPRWLFVEGDARLLHRVSSGALVGTRKATSRGRAVAERCAELLVEAGFCVISGLADGIDDAAHTATVELNGPAVAVVGTGILLDFPATTAGLRRRIVETGGTIVSEYLPETRYSRQTFVMRNRLIAALSAVVVPVEGAVKSGTAHTVRFARELDRHLVTAWYGEFGSSNELASALRLEGVDFFDLETAEGTQRFLRLLDSYDHDAAPLERDPEAVFKRIYGPALRELWKAVQRRPPDEEAVRWLMQKFDSLITKAKGPAND